MIKDIILGVWETIVLIETLWNVNEYEGLKDDKGSGSINRNIVECKLRQNSSTKLSAIVY